MLNTFKKCSFWIAFVAIMLLLLTWISLGASTKYNLDQSNKELIRGVDVSSYQGEINWEAFDAQDIRFAFIKATEGSYYADETFEKNAEAAERHGIYVGAYLFFDYKDDAQKQAELFIKTVPKKAKRLPPVVDIENLPLDDLSSYDETISKINSIVIQLKEVYGKTPILYINHNIYDTYVATRFLDCPIWISDYTSAEPSLSDGRKWTFWQYSNRGLLFETKGAERFVDMNLFNGNIDSLKAFLN